jgi:hypothetical protein
VGIGVAGAGVKVARRVTVAKGAAVGKTTSGVASSGGGVINWPQLPKKDDNNTKTAAHTTLRCLFTAVTYL